MLNPPDQEELNWRKEIRELKKKSAREYEIEYHKAISDELKETAKIRAKADTKNKYEKKKSQNSEMITNVGNISKRMNDYWTQ